MVDQESPAGKLIQHSGPGTDSGSTITITGDNWIVSPSPVAANFDSKGHLKQSAPLSVTHGAPDTASGTARFGCISALGVGGSSIYATFINPKFDSKGHYTATASGISVPVISLENVTVVTDVQVTPAGLVQIKTRQIFVPIAGSASGWITIHTGTTCS